jgi:Bacterial Ig-like domain/FG-GAP-like repeat
VTTQAGTFTGAAHVRTVAHFSWRYTGRLGSRSAIVTAEEWFAPGVGPVRSVSTTTAVGVPTEIDTEEVVAYGVGGRHSESVAPMLVSANPPNNSVGGSTPAIELYFSEPLDPQTVDVVGAVALVGASGWEVPVQQFVAVDGARIDLQLRDPLPDGRYEIRLGGALTDLANNPLPATRRAFTVDTTGPHVIATQPAQGAMEAATTGTVLLRFNEPVFIGDGSTTVMVTLEDFSGKQYLPGLIQGTDVVATLTTPLLRSHEYILGVATPLKDAVGNYAVGSVAAARFSTDPGPLARPTKLMNEVAVGAVTLGDVNGDGRSDIVFSAQRIGFDDIFIAARLRQADGHFAAATRLYALPQYLYCQPGSITVTDVNGDGRADLALAGCPNALTVLVQQAAGGFVAEVPAPTVTAIGYGSIDLDGDGRSEIVATEGGEFRFLRRDLAGTWSVALTLPGGSNYIGRFRLADLDGDGRADLVWTRTTADNTGFEVAWALRQGNGFGAVRNTPFSGRIEFPALAVADVTGDGRADVLMLTRQPNNSQVVVFAQTPSGELAAPVFYGSYFDAASINTADLDGDGKQDVLVPHSVSGGLGVYLQSSGILQPERRFETTPAYHEHVDDLVVVDFDADGRKDVVLGADVLLGRPVVGTWPASVPASARRTALAEASAAVRANRVENPLAKGPAALGGATRLLQRLQAVTRRQASANPLGAPTD